MFVGSIVSLYPPLPEFVTVMVTTPGAAPAMKSVAKLPGVNPATGSPSCSTITKSTVIASLSADDAPPISAKRSLMVIALAIVE